MRIRIFRVLVRRVLQEEGARLTHTLRKLQMVWETMTDDERAQVG